MAFSWNRFLSMTNLPTSLEFDHDVCDISTRLAYRDEPSFFHGYVRLHSPGHVIIKQSRELLRRQLRKKVRKILLKHFPGTQCRATVLHYEAGSVSVSISFTVKPWFATSLAELLPNDTLDDFEKDIKHGLQTFFHKILVRLHCATPAKQ